MAEIANPNYIGSRRFRDWMGQSSATSGEVPRQSVLDSIIQNELDAAYNNMYRRKQLELQTRQMAEARRQFDVGQLNAMDTAEANRQAGLLGTAMQAGTTYALYSALKPPVVPPVPGATGLSTALVGGQGASLLLPEVTGAGAGATGLGAAAYTLPEVAPVVGESLAPLTVAGETTLGATSAAEGASLLIPGATLTGETTALTGTEAAGATGFAAQYPTLSTIGSYAAPAAAGYVGAELGGALGRAAGEAIGVGGESEQTFIGKVGGGALAGAYVGGPYGAAIGATVGLIDWGFTEGKDFISDVGETIGDAASDLWDSTFGSIF